jgi:ACDE family multidrug resistance protein
MTPWLWKETGSVASNSTESSLPFSLLVSGTLMAVAGVALISPILPTVRETFGLSPFQVSALIWVYMAPGVVLAPFIGYVADRWGRRRVLVSSLLLFGTAGGLGSLSDGFQGLLVARLIQGIGGIALPLMARTLIGDFYDRERARYMGYHDAWLSLGGAVFPVLGGWFGQWHWSFPFIVYVLAVPIGVWAWLVLPRRDSHGSGEGTYLGRLLSRVDWGQFGFLLGAISSLFVLKYGFMYTALPFIVERGFVASSGWIGLAVGLMGGVVAVVAAFQGPVRDFILARWIIPAGFMSYGAGLLFAGVAGTPVGLGAGIVCAGVGHGLLLPTLNTAITRLTDSGLRGGVMSIRKIFVRGGQTIGSPLLAWFGQRLGMADVVLWTGFLVIGLSFIGFVISFVIQERKVLL